MIFNFVFILYRVTATSWSQTGYSERWRQHIFRLRCICPLGCRQEPQVQGSEGGVVWVENGLTALSWSIHVSLWGVSGLIS